MGGLRESSLRCLSNLRFMIKRLLMIKLPRDLFLVLEQLIWPDAAQQHSLLKPIVELQELA